MVLDKTLESFLDSKEVKQINPKGNQLRVFIGSTDAKTEAPILWPPDANSFPADSLEKTLMLGNMEGKRKRAQQKMRSLDSISDSVDVCEFEQTLGDSEEQRSLVCCSLWGLKESDTT